MADKGYKRVDQKASEPDRPPTPEEVLEPILKRAKYKPKLMPADPFQAARWFMGMIEKHDDFAEPCIRVKPGVWDTPYHDRLAARLRVFLRLKHIHQLYIYENVQRGIPWRGDPIPDYKRIVDEHDRMLRHKEAGKFEDYVTEGFRLMKKALRRMPT